MSDINEYLRELNNLQFNLHSIISNAIIKNEGLILQRLKLRLFNKGIDGSGKKIKPDYAKITIETKKLNNQRTSHVTLRDTGLFYASMYVEYTKNELFVNSDSDKYLFLAKKYGDDILGLTKEDQEFVILTIIEPAVIKVINRINKINIDL